MNLHLLNRSFNFIRHRQSVSILSNIGRDSRLSPTGEEYSRRLAKYVEDVISKGKRSDSKGNVTKYDRPFRMWTFILRRTKETAQLIQHTVSDFTIDNEDNVKWVQYRSNQDELYAGTCDDMNYKQIEEFMLQEFERRYSHRKES